MRWGKRSALRYGVQAWSAEGSKLRQICRHTHDVHDSDNIGGACGTDAEAIPDADSLGYDPIVKE